MEASIYLALEKMSKERKVGYGSADIAALIFDKCGGLKLVDKHNVVVDVSPEFYLTAAHFISECVAADRHCEVNAVSLSEVAALFRRGRDKMFEVKNNLATDLGVKNCATEFGKTKFKIITEATNGVRTSEKQFNDTHTAPDFTPRDVLISKSLEMVFGPKASVPPKK